MSECNENLRDEAKLFTERLVAKIKLIRAEKKLTADILASALGYKIADYNSIEDGLKSLSLSDFFKICDTLDVDPRDVLKSIAGIG